MKTTNIEKALFSMTIGSTRVMWDVVVTRWSTGWQIGRIDGSNILSLVDAIDAVMVRQ